MQSRIEKIKKFSQREDIQSESFSVYSPTHEQNLLNVPILKPVLIIICSGEKELESKTKVETCYTNQFVFISGSNSIGMRNIPEDNSYYAVLIEFEDDELPLQESIDNTLNLDFFIGDVDNVLQDSIAQFMEISAIYPEDLLKSRRKEIIQLMIAQGFNELFSIKRTHKLTEMITEIMKRSDLYNINVQRISDQIGLSESTLHRKLKEENTSIKEIKDRVRMGSGLHLLQTTDLPVSVIADKCGYSTHSKFSLRFKKHFGITPADLKKTKNLVEPA